MMLSERLFENEGINKSVALPEIHYQIIGIFPSLGEKNSGGDEATVLTDERPYRWFTKRGLSDGTIWVLRPK
jgi:hypothetical protein